MTENPAIVDSIAGTAVAVRGNDIDTDRIIPARFLRCVTFAGLGEQLFRDERFREDGSEKLHPLNDPDRAGASIMIVNRNFGCGSSREHAPQAIMRFGIRAIIGESFAEIFAGNCTSLGIPVFTATEETVHQLQKLVDQKRGTRLNLSLAGESVEVDGRRFPLAINRSAKTALLAGTWNTLDELLQNSALIDTVYRRLPYIF